MLLFLPRSSAGTPPRAGRAAQGTAQEGRRGAESGQAGDASQGGLRPGEDESTVMVFSLLLECLVFNLFLMLQQPNLFSCWLGSV